MDFLDDREETVGELLAWAVAAAKFPDVTVDGGFMSANVCRHSEGFLPAGEAEVYISVEATVTFRADLCVEVFLAEVIRLSHVTSS